MVTIYNSQLSKEIFEGTKAQTSKEQIPTQLAEKVIPTMEVNPKLFRRTAILATTSKTTTLTGSTIVAAVAGKEHYITGLNIANVQDATSDNVLITMAATIDGISRTIYARRKPTTTASTTYDFISFAPCIKCDKNTAITFTCAFTAGTSTTEIIVYGYSVDNINA